MSGIISYDPETGKRLYGKDAEFLKSVEANCAFLGEGTDAEVSYDETNSTYLVIYTRTADYDNERMVGYFLPDGTLIGDWL